MLSESNMYFKFDRFPIVEGNGPERNYLEDKSLNRQKICNIVAFHQQSLLPR